MPHIDLKNDFPGIRSVMAYRPDTAAPMSALAEILLRSDEGLSRTEREIIGAYVSRLNDCFYCYHSHAAIASRYLGGDEKTVYGILNDPELSAASPKLTTLLTIAGKVQQGGKAVLPADIDEARRHGATDMDIHDTVLIAAAFCMFNRYVDGLDTYTPDDMASYPKRAAQVAEKGYGIHIIQDKQPL